MADYLICGFFTNPAGITKVDLATFLKEDYLSLGFNVVWGIQWMVTKGNDLYGACFDSDPGRIVKVNLTTFTKVSALDLDIGESDLFGAAISGNFLYVGSGDNKIIKINLSTFTREAVVDLNYASPTSLHISGDYLYVVHYSDPAAVTKIGLSTFVISKEQIYAGEKNITSGIIYDGHIYGACVRNPGKILKINLSDLSLDAALALAGNENRAECMDIYRGYLYVGLHTELGEDAAGPYVAKVSLSTFTEVGSPLGDAVTHRTIWAAKVVGSNLYLGDYSTPVRIIKVDLDTFSKSDELVLPVNDENNISRNFVVWTSLSEQDFVDQTVIGNKVSLEAIRNLEIVYGGRFYINKSGNAVYESRYHRNV